MFTDYCVSQIKEGQGLKGKGLSTWFFDYVGDATGTILSVLK